MILKLTREERIKIRESRQEWHIVIKRCRKRYFKYVLQREAPGRLCFGSSVVRECLPTKGPAKTSLMRRYIPDEDSSPGPAKYDLSLSLIKQCYPKVGYAGLAYRAPRATITELTNPPIGLYNLDVVKKVKENAKPFNRGAKLDGRPPDLTPPPGTYNIRKRNIMVNEGFGKQRIHFSAVRTICTPRNLAKCCVCDEVPLGDYLRNWTTKQDMCRPCMAKERRQTQCKRKTKNRKMKSLAELNSFTRVRYCGFYHEHGNTKAALKLLTRRELNLKLRTENYLSMFHM